MATSRVAPLPLGEYYSNVRTIISPLNEGSMPATPADEPSGQHEDAARMPHEAGDSSTGDPMQDESTGWRELPPSTEDWLSEDE